MHADVGYAHGEIPKLELVVWPAGLKTKPQGSAEVALGSGRDGWPEQAAASAAASSASSTREGKAAGSKAAAGGTAQEAAPPALFDLRRHVSELGSRWKWGSEAAVGALIMDDELQ